MEVETKKILDKLNSLERDIKYIKANMIDPDSIMSNEEQARFEQSMKELAAGKTTSHTDLKAELGL